MKIYNDLELLKAYKFYRSASSENQQATDNCIKIVNELKRRGWTLQKLLSQIPFESNFDSELWNNNY